MILYEVYELLEGHGHPEPSPRRLSSSLPRISSYGTYRRRRARRPAAAVSKYRESSVTCLHGCDTVFGMLRPTLRQNREEKHDGNTQHLHP